MSEEKNAGPPVPARSDANGGAVALVVLWTVLVMISLLVAADTGGVRDEGAHMWWFALFAVGAAVLWVVTAIWSRRGGRRPIPLPWMPPLLLVAAAYGVLVNAFRGVSVTGGGSRPHDALDHAVIALLTPVELGVWALALWVIARSARGNTKDN